MLASSHVRRLSIRLLVALLLTVIVGRPATAQEPALRLVPDAFLACDRTLELEIQLDTGPLDGTGPVVAGYQLFLRYPAALVRPTAFEAQQMDETIWLAGPDEFAPVFDLDGCDAGVADPWQDGAGEDVLAVIVTTLDDGDGGDVLGPPQESLEGVGFVLGRIRFAVVDDAPEFTSLTFRLNEETCREPFDQETRVFDELGVAIGASRPESVVVDVVTDGAVEDLICARGEGDVVELSWRLPDGAAFDGVRVSRGGSELATLAGDATDYVDADAAGLDMAQYSIVPILAGGGDGCEAVCEVGITREFFRGDANLDGRLAIPDAVTILRYLFQAGPLGCADAADSDDDGALTITDAVVVFDFLFRRGPALPPPGAPTPINTVPGPDPTPDALGCDVGVAPAV